MTKRNTKKTRMVRFLSLFLATLMLVTVQSFAILADGVSQNDMQNLSAEKEADDGQGVMMEDTAVPVNPFHYCTKEEDGSIDYTDFSYVYFGSYPQSEVTDQAIIAVIESEIEAADDAESSERETDVVETVGTDVEVDGIKYRRISADDCNSVFGNVEKNSYRYFKWERIKWRVLDNDDDGTLFVAADKALDCKCYNDENVVITWEDSAIRNWLNDNFYQTAFSNAEQSAIESWFVLNEENPGYGTKGGNDTIDNVYLLSIEEVTKEQYGFCSDDNTDSASRRLQTSDYAHARGALRSSDSGYEDNCWWWLRSPADDSCFAVCVNDAGVVYDGDNVDSCNDSVVPVLHIDPSSDLWSVVDDGENQNPSNQQTPQPAGTSLTASQVTSLTDIVPQGASFTVTSSDPEDPTVSFDGVSDENAAVVTIPKTITFDGVEYRVTTVSLTAFTSKKDNAKFIVTDNRVDSLTVEYKAPANAKKTKAKTSVSESATYKGIKFKVTSVAAKAFKNNKKVKQVSIAGSVTQIGASCFEGCINLKTVTIGKSLQTIGNNAFKNCKKLTKITIKSTKLMKVGKNALKGINAKCKIKVPKKQLKNYQKLFQKKGQKNSVKVVK